MNNNRPTYLYLNKTDKKYTSLKLGCPFLIQFNYISKQKKYRGPFIFFQVKITSTNTHHACGQNTVSRRAVFQSGGHLVRLDDHHFSYVTNFIKVRPNIRYHIEKCFSNFKGINLNSSEGLQNN